jgi:hypothetical protein
VEKSLKGSEAKKLNGTNGSVASMRWLVGIGAVIVIGVGGFFATNTFTSIDRRLERIEGQQLDMMKSIAELKAVANVKP